MFKSFVTGMPADLEASDFFPDFDPFPPIGKPKVNEYIKKNPVKSPPKPPPDDSDFDWI